MRIERVDLDDLAEAVGFVRLLIDVPALLETSPGIALARKSEAAIISALGVIGQRRVDLRFWVVGDIAAEAIEKILLCHQINWRLCRSPVCHWDRSRF